jgi:hypothetical protein
MGLQSYDPQIKGAPLDQAFSYNPISPAPQFGNWFGLKPNNTLFSFGLFVAPPPYVNPRCIQQRVIVIVYKYLYKRVFNRLVCKCEWKLLWWMKLLDLVLKVFFFLVILSELRVKCVIKFGRFVRSFRGLMQIIERDHYFQCLIK